MAGRRAMESGRAKYTLPILKVCTGYFQPDKYPQLRSQASRVYGPTILLHRYWFESTADLSGSRMGRVRLVCHRVLAARTSMDLLIKHCYLRDGPWRIMPKASCIMLCQQSWKCNYYASEEADIMLNYVLAFYLWPKGWGQATCCKLADYGCSTAMKL